MITHEELLKIENKHHSGEVWRLCREIRRLQQELDFRLSEEEQLLILMAHPMRSASGLVSDDDSYRISLEKARNILEEYKKRL